MNWPPHFVLDLDNQNALPHDWAAQVQAATHAPECVIVRSGADSDEKFSVLAGTDVRARFDWLWRLYLGPIRAFVADRFGRAVYPANRISSAITLNILEGVGAEAEWHTDANPVTGVFYAAVPVGSGGELEFRHPGCPIAQIHPRAGAFICFPGSIEHRVVPLRSPEPRLAFAMLFYDSAIDQPFANLDDRHELSVA
ncbi:MAG: hypothetical protein JWN66_3054 [Sphingomonas bacterium]|uniref:2OG-Fe(II) oxygenase n=1 Tax=Sphingomonas bacterium TaxID=1895847 RepID=UPI0026221D19|nr:2OG-Fe(II) oxygenase [Sphingomonas bacterium]MDB5705938.1 hypothetical protein [Sphingomonas bacterium]